jgi:ribosomal protein S18 acetylase RimI-like enzyme
VRSKPLWPQPAECSPVALKLFCLLMLDAQQASPEQQLADIVWSALTTGHRDLALARGGVRKYPADVAPFAAFADTSPEAAAQNATDLHSLMLPGEMCYVIADKPLAEVAGLASEGELLTVQMAWPDDAEIPAAAPQLNAIVPLTCENAAEMMELIEVAFPGFFRERTCVMGPYSGIRIDGRLVAMAGDRMVTDKLREISGLCTHPAYTGRGLASILLLHKLREHREAGYGSLLHAAASNARAIPIYERLGFVHTRKFMLQRVRRAAAE